MATFAFGLLLIILIIIFFWTQSAILTLDDTVLDADQVENLIKFTPTKEEAELLKVIWLLGSNVVFISKNTLSIHTMLTRKN